jgi:hypothetical protein
MYHAKWEKQGVKIYAVTYEIREQLKWREFINKYNLQSWINVYQTEAQKKESDESKKTILQTTL